MYIVYKLTRDDGKVYIGTTYTEGFRSRMGGHRRSNRFKNSTFSIDILEESDDYEYIMSKETFYIKVYDSFNNGLNESIDGKGNHLSLNFTTKGYKFSEESRRKIGDASRERMLIYNPFKGKHHKEETKARWSSIRKGKQWCTPKLNESQVREILNLYHIVKPELDGVGVVMRNGKLMSYERAFAIKHSVDYNVTPQAVEGIIKGKVWPNVQREFKI